MVVEDSSLLREQGDQLPTLLEEQKQLQDDERDMNSNQEEEHVKNSIHLEENEIDSFGGEWRDSWKLERSGRINHAS